MFEQNTNTNENILQTGLFHVTNEKQINYLHMKIMYKIAAMLALFIGVISVFAGSKVLLGLEIKNYTVFNSLVIYNLILGIISMIAAYLIWKNLKSSKQITIAILVSHTLVLTYLYFMSENVAPESIKAMSFRVSIWIVIYLLTYKTFNI